MQISLMDLSPMILIAYLRFLTTNGSSAPTLANHLSDIKANLAIYGLPTQLFHDPRIKYFQKCITLHRPFKPSLKSIIDIDTLQLIVRLCDSTYMGQVVKAVYTVAFFSFLRLSNLVPHSTKLFSPISSGQRRYNFAPPWAPHTGKVVQNHPGQKNHQNSQTPIPGFQPHLSSHCNQESPTNYTWLQQFPPVPI